jgi:hypothetical protein
MVCSKHLEYSIRRSVSPLTLMRKNTVVLIVVLILLGALYAYFWTDWFKPPTIQILFQIRPVRNVRSTPGMATVYPVSFAFDRKVSLTEIRVVSVEDEKTNKYPHSVWHMISDSNSIPVKALIYGQGVRGMKPKVPRARPETLLPDVKYRLYISSGKFQGQIDFKTLEAAEPGQ